MGLFGAESNPAIRIKENMDMTMTSLKAKSSKFVVAPKSLFAWHRIREYQTIIRTNGYQSEFSRMLNGKSSYALILDNRSSIPISPYVVLAEEKIKKLIEPNNVAQTSHQFAETESEANTAKTNMVNFLGIGLLLLVAMIGGFLILKITHKI